MSFTEDMTDFFDTNDFADTITVDGDSVNAIYEEQYVDFTVGGAQYHGVMPTITGARADIEGKNGTTVVVNSTNYTIVDIQHQDTMVSIAILEVV